MLIQEHLFRRALREFGITQRGVKIDHFAGVNFHPLLGRLPLVWPISQLDRAKALRDAREGDREGTFFRGTITTRRSWVRQFPNVEESNYGRDRKLKFQFDEDYWSQLVSAEFALAPSGDCPWSYRFFEAIIAGAIPVLHDEDPDVYAPSFHVIRFPSQPIEYSEKLASENFRKLCLAHTIPSLIPGYLKLLHLRKILQFKSNFSDNLSIEMIR